MPDQAQISAQITYTGTEIECRGLVLESDGAGAKLASASSSPDSVLGPAFDRASASTPPVVRHFQTGDLGFVRLTDGAPDVTSTNVSLVIEADGTARGATAGDSGKPAVGRSANSITPGRGITYVQSRDGKKYVNCVVGPHAVP